VTTRFAIFPFSMGLGGRRAKISAGETVNARSQPPSKPCVNGIVSRPSHILRRSDPAGINANFTPTLAAHLVKTVRDRELQAFARRFVFGIGVFSPSAIHDSHSTEVFWRHFGGNLIGHLPAIEDAFHLPADRQFQCAARCTELLRESENSA